MRLGGIGVRGLCDSGDGRVSWRGGPRAGQGMGELAGWSIALAVLHMLLHSEIQRRIRIGGGDNVPAGAPAAEMVERSEAPCDVIGRVEGSRAGGDETDALRNL